VIAGVDQIATELIASNAFTRTSPAPSFSSIFSLSHTTEPAAERELHHAAAVSEAAGGNPAGSLQLHRHDVLHLQQRQPQGMMHDVSYYIGVYQKSSLVSVAKCFFIYFLPGWL
jgi:hypothetical protein